MAKKLIEEGKRSIVSYKLYKDEKGKTYLHLKVDATDMSVEDEELFIKEFKKTYGHLVPDITVSRTTT